MPLHTIRLFTVAKLLINAVAFLLLVGLLLTTETGAVPTLVYVLMLPITAHSVFEAVRALVRAS